MAPIIVNLSKFIEGVENGLIIDIFSIIVGSEKRIYGKTREGQASNPNQFQLVYAVIP